MGLEETLPKIVKNEIVGIIPGGTQLYFSSIIGKENMKKDLYNIKIDKRAFSVVSLSDQSNDKHYCFGMSGW
jgi:hypothetical protein